MWDNICPNAFKCRAVFSEIRYRYLLIRSKKASNQKIPDSASGCERCVIKKPAHKSPFFPSIFYSISQGSIPFFPFIDRWTIFFSFLRMSYLEPTGCEGERSLYNFSKGPAGFSPSSLPFSLQLSVFSPLNADWLRSVSMNIWMAFRMERKSKYEFQYIIFFKWKN